jgi:GT2 family glycosyltransferase
MNSLVKTAVIVVNFNGKDFLDRCLDSLRCQTFSHFKIVIVDNASDDGSADGIEERFSNIEVIRSDKNIGFAAANNLAVHRTEGCKWIALLNPDAFAEPDWLLNLHHAARENPEYSFFGSHMKQYGSHGRLDGTGDIYHLCGLAWRRDHGISEDQIPRSMGEIFSPCGAAAMYRRDVFLDAGGFDESFFCYFEDIDLAFRLRLLGQRCLYVPSAKVEHVGSANAIETPDQYPQNNRRNSHQTHPHLKTRLVYTSLLLHRVKKFHPLNEGFGPQKFHGHASRLIHISDKYRQFHLSGHGNRIASYDYQKSCIPDFL